MALEESIQAASIAGWSADNEKCITTKDTKDTKNTTKFGL
jgi:hypothetical protein